MQEVWIRSLVRGLRSHTPRGQKDQNIKKKKKKQRNEAEKHKHLSKGNFAIQVKSSDPRTHVASSNTHYLCLLEARRSGRRPCSRRSHNLLSFPNIILTENNIITKAAIIQLHCLCRWLLGPDFPFCQSPVTQSCYCAYQITSWKVRVVEKRNSKQPVSYHMQRKAVPLFLNQ